MALAVVTAAKAPLPMAVLLLPEVRAAKAPFPTPSLPVPLPPMAVRTGPWGGFPRAAKAPAEGTGDHSPIGQAMRIAVKLDPEPKAVGPPEVVLHSHSRYTVVEAANTATVAMERAHHSPLRDIEPLDPAPSWPVLACEVVDKMPKAVVKVAGADWVWTPRFPIRSHVPAGRGSDSMFFQVVARAGFPPPGAVCSGRATLGGPMGVVAEATMPPVSHSLMGDQEQRRSVGLSQQVLRHRPG